MEPENITNGTAPDNARLRIIVADDNHGLMGELLRTLSWEFDVVATVQNGRELIEAYERYHPDVVVSDISMPVLDGFEAAVRLARIGNPPIVFFTIHDDVAFIEEAKSLGASGYVLKGSPPSVLSKAIRSAYSERRHSK
ncbi:MAG: response regulator transcription factor [Bryobacterales bacterium]|nr:response regulator transcription factor [Bryobacterales bacterium]